jgi:hypothetical protein
MENKFESVLIAVIQATCTVIFLAFASVVCYTAYEIIMGR